MFPGQKVKFLSSAHMLVSAQQQNCHLIPADSKNPEFPLSVWLKTSAICCFNTCKINPGKLPSALIFHFCCKVNTSFCAWLPPAFSHESLVSWGLTDTLTHSGSIAEELSPVGGEGAPYCETSPPETCFLPHEYQLADFTGVFTGYIISFLAKAHYKSMPTVVAQ